MKRTQKGTRRFCILLLVMLTLMLLLLICFQRLSKARHAEPELPESETPPGADSAPDTFLGNAAPQIRIFDGELQWFDGARWTTFATLAALSAEDPAVLAEANLVTPQPAETEPTEFHNRAEGTVPRSSGSGGSGGSGGGGGGSSGGGSSGGSDGEDIDPFG